jgi:SAM-dependent methyltransferase
MDPAFKTWNRREESLESVERRIHDGVPEEQLRSRGEGYIATLLRRFPWSRPKPHARILEIGSGVGYVLQAALQQLEPAQIIGLDVAANMIDKAKRRLQRDGIADPRLGFLHYDGLRIPVPDDSFDYVYSVACIQHIPKPYAYHLFYEILRVLKPHGFAALHMASVACLPERHEPLYEEIVRQLHGREGHWHHYYSFDELFYVLSAGVGVDELDIQEGAGSLWVSFSKASGRKYHNPDLPKLVFSECRRLLETGSQMRD